MRPQEALHAHTCGQCGTRWSHSGRTDGNWRSKHTCPRCRSWPWTRIERVKAMYRRRYAPRRFLAACCCNNDETLCDYKQCYGSCLTGAANTVMGALPPAADANSTSAGAPLPATGQPAGTVTPPPAATSSFMANLTNFSTPYPYVAIGGVVILAALLIPGGRKAGSSAPTVFHYG